MNSQQIKYPFLVIVWFCFMSINAFAQPKLAKYEVKSATLYTNQALIQISSKVSFDPGMNEIIFESLAPNIQKESLQLSIGNDIQVISIQCMLDNGNPNTAESGRVQGIKDSLRKYVDLQAYTKIKKFALDEEEKLILANKVLGNERAGGTSVEVEDMSLLYRTRLIEIKEDSYELNYKIEKLEKQVQFYKTELDKINSNNPLEKSKVILKLNSKRRAVLPVDLSFISYDAGWSPSYDLKSDGIGSDIQLIYKANLYQATGMEWNNIKLVLNTGNPSENGNKPVLNPWTLDFEKPRQAFQQKSNLSMDMSLAETSSALSFNQIETDLARSFELSQSISLPSSRDQNSIEIENYTVSANYEIVSIPKLDEAAYVIAEMKAWEKLGLVPANVNIYFDGAYIGQSYIDPLTSDAGLKISLGKDKNINIKREKLREFSSENFIGGKKTVSYTYQITIKNTHKEEIEIAIEDQIPVSQNKEIEIKLVDNGKGKLDEGNGKLNWKIKVSGANDKKLNFAFEVKYPKDKIIPNL